MERNTRRFTATRAHLWLQLRPGDGPDDPAAERTESSRLCARDTTRDRVIRLR